MNLIWKCRLKYTRSFCNQGFEQERKKKQIFSLCQPMLSVCVWWVVWMIKRLIRRMWRWYIFQKVGMTLTLTKVLWYHTSLQLHSNSLQEHLNSALGSPIPRSPPQFQTDAVTLFCNLDFTWAWENYYLLFSLLDNCHWFFTLSIPTSLVLHYNVLTKLKSSSHLLTLIHVHF